MIDIHTHIVPYVDDGSKSTEDSLALVKEEINQGVTDIICTPHFRRGMFESSLKETEQEFNLFKKEVIKKGYNVNLYLGQEIYIHHMHSFNRYLDNNYIRSLNETGFYLLEFNYYDEIDVTEIAYNVRLLGKNVIIAHIERYSYLSLDDARELKNVGAYIQVNASSIIGKHGLRVKSKVHKLLKNNLVDFVSSDIHVSRSNYLQKAYNLVSKKYGTQYADEIFTNNAKQLLIK